jgi:hypothetical protein
MKRKQRRKICEKKSSSRGRRISKGVREEWGNFREAIKWKGVNIPDS